MLFNVCMKTQAASKVCQGYSGDGVTAELFVWMCNVRDHQCSAWVLLLCKLKVFTEGKVLKHYWTFMQCNEGWNGINS